MGPRPYSLSYAFFGAPSQCADLVVGSQGWFVFGACIQWACLGWADELPQGLAWEELPSLQAQRLNGKYQKKHRKGELRRTGRFLGPSVLERDRSIKNQFI